MYIPAMGWLVVIVLSLVSPSGNLLCEDALRQLLELRAQCKELEIESAEEKKCYSRQMYLQSQLNQNCKDAALHRPEKLVLEWASLVEQCGANASERCQNALYQLAVAQVQAEKASSVTPKDFSKARISFRKFVDQFPRHEKALTSWYHLATLYEVNSLLDSAAWARKALVEQFVDDSLVAKSWLRIGEYHFDKEELDSAYFAFQKVQQTPLLHGKERALVLFHSAEILMMQGDFPNAFRFFVDYLVGVHENLLPEDLLKVTFANLQQLFAEADLNSPQIVQQKARIPQEFWHNISKK